MVEEIVQEPQAPSHRCPELHVRCFVPKFRIFKRRLDGPAGTVGSLPLKALHCFNWPTMLPKRKKLGLSPCTQLRKGKRIHPFATVTSLRAVRKLNSSRISADDAFTLSNAMGGIVTVYQEE